MLRAAAGQCSSGCPLSQTELAFFTSPDAPIRCAVAISRALYGSKHLPLRIGIHSGPVDTVPDVNDRPSVAGSGIVACSVSHLSTISASSA